MNRGFTLIETLLAVVLLAVFVLALTQSLSLSTFTVKQGENFSKAYALGQQQMEAILKIKNQGGNQWDWVNTPVNTNPGEYYQPTYSGGNWNLGTKTTTPDLTKDLNTLVEIKPVKRCGPNVCTDAWGVTDINSREVVVTIKWKERSQDQTLPLTLLVNHI